MAPLAKTNKYLNNASLDRIIEENARASSVFEGASPRACQVSSRVRNKTASAKKDIKGS